MPTIYPCPNCDKKIKVPDGTEGKKLKCPACQTLLLITEDGLEPAQKQSIQSAPAKAARKAPPPDEAEDEEEEAPKAKKRKAIADEDDEDEPRPKKRKAVVDDDDEEDEKPRKKKRKKSGQGIPMWVWLAGGGGLVAVIGLVLFLFVFSGGSSKFNKITVGMSEKEVTDLLGEPTTGDAKLLGVVLFYYPPIDKKDNLDLVKMSNFKEVAKVYYENGKVKSVKKLTKAEVMKNPLELAP